MFDSKLIEFFVRHNLYDEPMFDYFYKNCTIIDYSNLKQRDFIGCFYTLEKNNILEKIHLNVPYIYDDITRLINIHEFVHGILLYQKLHKQITIDDYNEVLPMLYEKIYINEMNNTELIKYDEELTKNIIKINELKYLIGLKYRDKLIEKYDYDINKMTKLMKKLVKKY